MLSYFPSGAAMSMVSPSTMFTTLKVFRWYFLTSAFWLVIAWRRGLADRPKRGFGDAIEEIAGHIDEPVLRVDHAEGDQPTQHDMGDHGPGVDIDHRVDEQY